MTETPRFFEQSGSDPLPPAILEGAAEPPATEAGLRMGMLAHLSELRRRILVCLAAMAVAAVVGFFYALPAIALLEKIAPPGVQFVQLSPGEVFFTSLRMTLYLAMALALPVILYQTLCFVMPGLINRRERAMALWSVAGGTLLFAGGVVFAYYYVIPPALFFLMDYGQTVALNQISIELYVSFCAALLLVTGGLFELPMVLFLLSFTGLITSGRLIREWRMAVIIIFTVAAIVTPSQDPFTMSIVGAAMVLLYGLSILPIRLMGR